MRLHQALQVGKDLQVYDTTAGQSMQAEGKMKCQRTACGREIQEDALYCPYCGKKQQRTAAPKPRKRANGKGCIYRSGKTWTIQVRVVRAGTVVYARKKCGFPTRAAAEEYLDTYTRTGVAPRSMRLIDCWTALQQTKKWQALSKNKRSHYGTAWRRLDLANIDLQRQCIIGGIKTAAGKNREIPIATAIVPLVAEAMQVATHGLADGCREHFYDRWCPAVEHWGGRPHMTAHSCRHTLATAAFNE